METREHQELRSRQQVSIRGILAAWLTAGTLNFVMSGGGPWSSAGTMNAIMGRDIPMGIFTAVLGHYVLTLIYTVVLALVIYRFQVVPALMIAIAASLGFYAVNFAIFRALGTQMQSTEVRPLMTHIVFCLFAAAVYKGASVPKPMASDEAADAETVPAASKKSPTTI